MAKKRKGRSKTTALIIDGSYARIQARGLGGNIDFASLRTELEELAATEFEECWYFDSQRSDARGNSALAAQYHALKFARPLGAQFQVEVFSTKRYNCHCTKCGYRFTQNVQKGVDNGMATKMLTLTLENHIDRLIVFSGDGDFHTSLGYVRNALRKEVWVVGFWDTVSGDLQQLASRIVWVNDMWGRVKWRGRGGLVRPDVRSSRLGHGNERRSSCRSGRRQDRRESRERCESPDSGRRSRLDIYGPPKRRRMASPRRDANPATSYRSPPPRSSDRGAIVGEFLFDGVNVSGSEDEGNQPSQAPSTEPPRPSGDGDNVGVVTNQVPGGALHLPSQFPLPMALPVSATSARSDTDLVVRPQRFFEWIFGNNAQLSREDLAHEEEVGLQAGGKT
ncbi:uncharacterized protein KRP23_6941 [Phytophthora ramorum]|uniref:uncharacterized protein n=1 Tax=Phytophthora ramorum TaxID=164328 RepID=UPI0030B04FB7|nr:hypothetical protein KRP23_6941 [Phytophthora ramorum]